MLKRLFRLSCALTVLILLGSPGVAGPAQWKKITGSRFTLLTPADQDEALKWAQVFSQYMAGLQGILPVDQRRLAPLTMVLFGRDPDFDDYRPLAENGKPKDVDGFFVRTDSWSVAALGSPSMRDESRRIFFHESTHWWISAIPQLKPIWLEEGMAELFSTFEVDSREVVWGEPIKEHVKMLYREQPLPIQQLVLLTHDTLFRNGNEADQKTDMAYAESWALAHFLQLGDAKIPANAIDDYLRRLRTEDPIKAFEQAFGHTCREFDAMLHSYVTGHHSGYTVLKQKPKPIPEFKIASATRAEVEQALGEVALGGSREALALSHAQAAIAAAPDQPAGYELQARVCEQRKDDAGAFAAYKEAVVRKSSDARAYFMYGFLRYKQVVEEGGGDLPAEEARNCANCYERAINLNPFAEAPYASLAVLLDHLPAGMNEVGPFVRQGNKVFPANPIIRIGVAFLDHADGHDEEALRRLDEVLAMKDIADQVRSLAERYRTKWTKTSAEN
jgi:tetratricopeptide (TPR) repeat protein